MIKTAIIGATGYTGSELVRLIDNHPEIDLKLITSESRKGERFSDVHPHFGGIQDITLHSVDTIDSYAPLDVVFLALPHGVSMSFVERFKNESFKIIDLSGDYRLSSPQVYEEWYSKKHSLPEAFDGAVYGLPELHREAIKKARLVANPGCYPTSSILGLAPLVENDLIQHEHIIIDAKSGVTGAGVKPKLTTHFSNVSDNFKAYGVKTHRHTIEIEEQLGEMAKKNLQVQFTPHLLPLDRGILATIYSRPKGKVTDAQVKEAYANFYVGHPFVRLRQAPPTLKDVRGTNFCDVFVTYDERTNRIITLAAIDNLVKGAAGQAIQNLNLMFDLEETTGLRMVPLSP